MAEVNILDVIDIKIEYFRKNGEFYTTETISVENIYKHGMDDADKYHFRRWIQKQIESNELSKENYAICSDRTYIDKPIMIHPQKVYKANSMLNLQDFRNELLEVFFKAHHHMEITSDTYASNLISMLISTLDSSYGTEYQKTPSIIKADKKRAEREEPQDEQIKLF